MLKAEDASTSHADRQWPARKDKNLECMFLRGLNFSPGMSLAHTNSRCSKSVARAERQERGISSTEAYLDRSEGGGGGSVSGGALKRDAQQPCAKQTRASTQMTETSNNTP